MMSKREQRCKACDGTGLLADDEFWQYQCVICGGEGVLVAGEQPERDELINVDEMNRMLD